jgi:hypothetical protein
MPCKPEPPKPTRWNIYKVAAKAIWLGTIEGWPSGLLVPIIINNNLFHRHQDDEKDAHPHTHRRGGYPEDQILRHCFAPVSAEP